MISDTERDCIQAEAYRNLKKLNLLVMEDSLMRAYLNNEIVETETKLKQHSTDVEAILHELDRTRWKRLQNTQFVHLGIKEGPPKIMHTNGSTQYLIEHSHLYAERLLSQKIFDDLARIEHTLFHTEDEAVVYWTGHCVWNIGKYNRNKFGFQCNYFMAYIYADEVHLEPNTLPFGEEADRKMEVRRYSKSNASTIENKNWEFQQALKNQWVVHDSTDKCETASVRVGPTNKPRCS